MIALQNLTIEEVNLILAGLSELPTKSGAYPVAMKIKTQADAQLEAMGAQAQQDASAQSEALAA